MSDRSSDRILLGDNLAILRSLPDDTVQCIYADPPYFTQKDWGDFSDTFKSMDAYIGYLRERVVEMRRILTPSGIMVIQCDWHADAYIRVMCDQIFGYDRLINHIIWKRTVKIKPTAKSFGKCSDSIFMYAKSAEYRLEVPKVPLNDDQIAAYYIHVEPETGKRFNSGGLIRSGNNPKTLSFPNGKVMTAPDGMRWSWCQSTLDARLAENPLVIHWTSGKYPRYKIYLDEHEGQPMINIWDDIQEVSSSDNSRLDYATQKPEKLLERILLPCTKRGDWVLDPFCGSGTSCAVAKKFGRHYIGIDKNPDAVAIATARMIDPNLGCADARAIKTNPKKSIIRKKSLLDF